MNARVPLIEFEGAILFFGWGEEKGGHMRSQDLRRFTILNAVAILFLVGLFAFAGSRTQKAARVVLQPADGSNVQGEVTFLETEKGTKVIVNVTGLAPKSVHGVHVHEKGLCEKPGFQSAGGHFNPTGSLHGGAASEHRHVGDFGNIVANKDGVAKMELLIPHLRLRGETSIIGRALIVHAQPDDLFSQPTGDAGDRIACGVIEEASRAPRELQR